ncbi:MAG: amidase [Ruminococcaceae bacterium]|nr:amidase [Oscillospiraceae bacterium]
MAIIEYDRNAVLEYAGRWANSRNPEFYDFSGIGGDCTNFASQCVYAGAPIMNYTPDLGWYYISVNDRSPSWTGASFFYNFMVNNTGPGPFGEEIPLRLALPGDIIQLSNENGEYYHTLVLTSVRYTIFGRRYFVSAHSRDAYQKSLASYNYASLRCIHILGARTNDLSEGN